jgi:transposase
MILAKPFSVSCMSSEILGVLPLIKHFTDRIRLVEAIDRIIPKKKAPGDVTHGECVLIMLICLLDGDHRLVHIEKKLLDLDLTALLGRSGVEARAFNDTRLGTALDALYGNTTRIYGDILASTIKEFGLRAKRFHVDTTTIVLRGLYEVLEVLPSLREPPPIPARGFSKDHRPDLLQLMHGMVVTEEGIPTLGRFENGNSSDAKLFRDYMAELPEVSDLFKTSKPVLIGDSKLCTIETIDEAAQLGVDLVTLFPETFSLAKAVDRQDVQHPQSSASSHQRRR